MFDFLKTRPADVKSIRNAIVQFIKEELQKAEGGEGENIKGVYLYLTCNQPERHLYESALYLQTPDKFRTEEVQKIVDDYAINLPAGWIFETEFVVEVPAEAIKAPDVDAALYISTRNKPSLQNNSTAYFRVLHGEAESEVYTLTSTGKKLNIGREKKARTSDGFYRENHIAFPGESSNESNRSVSRQHAHVEWDAQSAFFFLFANEGGIPPLNKTKVRKIDGSIEKIQTLEIGHRLEEGDQVMLGEGVVMEFTYHGA